MRTILLALLATLIGCGAAPVRPTAAPEGTEADLIILQLNDVYEVNPVGGAGGLARVATLRDQLAQEGPVLTVLAGDFLSPSAMGLAKVDGERLGGAQMVATFDAMGLDVTTIGNHEFDVKEAQLLARLEESKFAWISANVTRADGSAFPKVTPHTIRTVGGVKVGLFGLTIGSNPRDWVKYDTDYAGVAKAQIAALKAQGAEVIVGLTHLDLEDDIALAAHLPEIDLIAGGHEHENWRIDRGPDFTPVRKADANARTVFVHRITRREGQAQVISELVHVGPELADQPATAAVAKAWTDKAFDAFRADGIDPEKVITTAWADLDGHEASVRNGSTLLTDLVGQALQIDDTTVVVYNSGSIRIDDTIPQGAQITAYDVLRILPFGGAVVSGSWTGALLSRVLEAGVANKGKGGWLQLQGVTGVSGAWVVNGKPLDPAATYRVATSDFMLKGLEDNLGFLTRTVEGISDLKDGADVRTLLIDRLGKGQRAVAAR